MLNEDHKEEGLSLSRIKTIDKTEASYEWKVHQAAIEYINAGYYVIPVQQNGKAIPERRYNVNYGTASRSRKVIDKWFNPQTGIFAGWNIGIATGREDGCFVIDVDRHGTVDGTITLDKLEEKNGELPDGPYQTTPNEGFHFIFRWSEGCSASTGKIGPGIDTRGGDALACKGHINVWPSVVDGKTYEWVQGGPLPDTPKWINDALGIPWNPTSARGIGRGNENVGDVDVEQPIEDFQIKSMLEHIDPDDVSYDEWLRIGLSIKSQLPDQDGFEIWDEWSRRGSRYKSRECEIRWDGFSDYGTVRGGTLFYLAKQHGWKPDPKKGERSGNPIDEIVEEMNQTFAIVTVGGKVRIIREKKAYSKEGNHYELMDKDSFTLLMGNKKMVYVDDQGKAKKASIGLLWLAHEGRRTYENGMGLYPDNKPPEGYYNTWNGFSVDPQEGDCSLFISHITDVICNGREKLANWLLDWIADLIQFPASPKGCAIVMRGGEGTGKGTLANTIGDLFGSHYQHLIDDNHLLSNFNSHLFDAVFLFADEITWGGNKKTAGKLKGLVTEEILVGERKGVDAIRYRNLVHMMIASNSEWVIPAGADSRRWFVLDVPSTRAGDIDYFDRIRHELDNGGKEAILHYFLTRKIKSNLRRAPVTEALREQRLLTSQDDTVLAWLVYSVTRGSMQAADVRNQEVNWPENVVKTDLHDDYARHCKDRGMRHVGISMFSKDLRKYKIGSARIKVGNERKYVFKIPPLDGLMKTIETKYPTIFGVDDDE